ncbi:hypothetical protein Tco_1263710 [Tanacetum coccineum]
MVAFLKKPEGSAEFHQIVDFLNFTHIKYALTENPTIYVSLIHQFWKTASASTSENGEMEITATIDGRVKTVTEASIRRHLKLEDSDGISTLPNTEIFEQLALMVPVESHNTPTATPSTLPPHILPTLRSPIRQETEVPQVSFPPHTNVADKAASTGVDVRHEGATTTVTSLDAGQGSGQILDEFWTHWIKEFLKGICKRVMTLGELGEIIREVFVKLLLDSFGKLSIRPNYKLQLVNAQEEAHTQQDQLEDHLRVLSAAKVLADAARKRREVINVQSYTRKRRAVSTGSGEISTAKESVSTAGASMPVSTAGMVQEASTPSSVATMDNGKAIMQESESPKKMKQREQIQISRDEEIALKLQEEFDAAERQRIARVYEEASTPSSVVTKDKGKTIMQESKSPKKMKQRDQIQISRDEEIALKLQEEFDAAERHMIARVHEEASSFNIEEYEDIQATIEADEELAQRIQAEEREKYYEAEKARLLAELINQRKKYFTQ